MNNYRYDLNKAIINTPRTQFRIPHNYKTTFNAGDLIPVFIDEVLPGDTLQSKLSAVCRELTLLNPVMDNSYLQFDFFFVPYRIIWNYTKQFFGENEIGAWTQTNDFLMPTGLLDIDSGENVLESCTIGDYLGMRVFGGNASELAIFNYLPLRAYAEIWNKYYMAESAQSYILYSKDNNIEFDERLIAGYNSKPLKVNRFSDRYTSAIPSPQKGPNVPFLADYFPVVPNTSLGGISYDDLPDENTSRLKWGSIDYNGDFYIKDYIPSGNVANLAIGGDTSGEIGNTVGYSMTSSSSGTPIFPSNLYASTVGSAIKDINNLRVSIATQHYYETLARLGSRYNESIYGLFGVKVPDLMIDNPQYLGSYKQLINVNQVAATAEIEGSPVGSTGAYSLTAISNKHIVNASFFEYGYVMCLAHVRTDSAYSQGIPKLFTKKSKFDIYNPLFANIGNVGIKNIELFYTDTHTDNEIFGYAEAWYEYKDKPNLLTGYMRPGVDNSFSSYTYGRVFADVPTLSSEFLEQTDEEVNRTIAVQTEISNQFKLDIFFDNKWSRIMPLYSIPGLSRI